VSGGGVRFTQSYFCQMGRAVHWNLFLCQRSGVCSQYKGGEETVYWMLSNTCQPMCYLKLSAMDVVDNLSTLLVVDHHVIEWPYSTLVSQVKVVVRLQRASHDMRDC